MCELCSVPQTGTDLPKQPSDSMNLLVSMGQGIPETNAARATMTLDLELILGAPN